MYTCMPFVSNVCLLIARIDKQDPHEADVWRPVGVNQLLSTVRTNGLRAPEKRRGKKLGTLDYTKQLVWVMFCELLSVHNAGRSA
jgi:hypothetical protein